MSQEKSKIMPMQFFFMGGRGGGGLKRCIMGFVQVVNEIQVEWKPLIANCIFLPLKS